MTVVQKIQNLVMSRPGNNCNFPDEVLAFGNRRNQSNALFLVSPEIC